MNDPLATAAAEDRLTKMLRLVTAQPDQAAHGIRTVLKDEQLHEADLQVLVINGDRRSELYRLLAENRELRAELGRLKGAKGLTWDDFVKACGERVNVTGNRWRATVANHLRVPVGELATYERHNRVPMTVLKQLETLPDTRMVKTKSDFKPSLAKIVQHLRKAKMPTKQVTFLLVELLRSYDGDEATLQAALKGEAAAMRAADDPTPVTEQEIADAARQLWGRVAPKRAMSNFMLTHAGVTRLAGSALDAAGAKRLRAAFHAELALRKNHDRFDRLSRAFALLPRQTKKPAETVEQPDLVGMSPDLIAALGRTWFGADYLACLGQLSGLGETAMQHIIANEPAPRLLETLLLTMQRVLDGLDLDDPALVEQVRHRASNS